jgi:hypothetical protein
LVDKEEFKEEEFGSGRNKNTGKDDGSANTISVDNGKRRRKKKSKPRQTKGHKDYSSNNQSSNERTASNDPNDILNYFKERDISLLTQKITHELKTYNNTIDRYLYLAAANELDFSKPKAFTPPFIIYLEHLSEDSRNKLTEFKKTDALVELKRIMIDAVEALIKDVNPNPKHDYSKLWVEVKSKEQQYNDDILLGIYRYEDQTERQTAYKTTTDYGINLFRVEINGIVSEFMRVFPKDSINDMIRNDLIDRLIAFMFSNKVSIDSTEAIVKQLYDNNENLEEKLKVVRQIYIDGSRGERIPTPLNNDAISKILLKHARLPRTLYTIDPNILNELFTHTFELISETSKSFVVARSDTKQIVQADIETHKIAEDYSEEKLEFEDTIINAIPTEIIQYENPTNPDIKYEIEFETPNGRKYKTDPLSLDEIIKYLRSKRLIYKIRLADEALPAILNAYERDGKITIKNEVDTAGFYLVDGKITAVKTDVKMPSKEEIIKCVQVLEHLSTKYKKPERFATIIKWGIAAPFSFVMKQLEDENLWLPMLWEDGHTKVGKTTDGRLILAISRKHRDQLRHDIGFTSLDTMYKFGAATSHNTFPVLVNEVNLTDYQKDKLQKQIVEALKHSIQSKTARSRGNKNDSKMEYFPALGSFMFTGNDLPPDEEALIGRMINIHHVREDEPTKEEKIAFDKYLFKERHINELGILGDFVAAYILEHQELIHEDWKAWSEKIITEFYRIAGRDAPKWVKLFVPEIQLEDIVSGQEQSVRGLLADAVNATYRFNFGTFNYKTEEKVNTSFTNRLDFCLDHKLISYLRRIENKFAFGGDYDILILQNVVEEIRKKGINHIHGLKELVNIIGGKYDVFKVDDKPIRAIKISESKLIEFIMPDL